MKDVSIIDSVIAKLFCSNVIVASFFKDVYSLLKHFEYSTIIIPVRMKNCGKVIVWWGKDPYHIWARFKRGKKSAVPLRTAFVVLFTLCRAVIRVALICMIVRCSPVSRVVRILLVSVMVHLLARMGITGAFFCHSNLLYMFNWVNSRVLPMKSH